jgi:hypothetical protein
VSCWLKYYGWRLMWKLVVTLKTKRHEWYPLCFDDPSPEMQFCNYNMKWFCKSKVECVWISLLIMFLVGTVYVLVGPIGIWQRCWKVLLANYKRRMRWDLVKKGNDNSNFLSSNNLVRFLPLICIMRFVYLESLFERTEFKYHGQQGNSWVKGLCEWWKWLRLDALVLCIKDLLCPISTHNWYISA